MLIYIYDNETKEYLRTQEAQRNPKRPTDYLMPANSTTEQVPRFGKNETVIFNENHWEIVKDFRGQEVLNFETMSFEIVDYIGEIKEGYELLDELTKEEFLKYPDAFKVINGKLVDIRGTEEFEEHLKGLFEKQFISTNLGNVRINTNWGNFLAIKPNYDNQVALLGYLPENCLILYKTPDFSEKFNSYSEVEKWLVENGQFKNKKVTAEEYAIFSEQVITRFAGEV